MERKQTKRVCKSPSSKENKMATNFSLPEVNLISLKSKSNFDIRSVCGKKIFWRTFLNMWYEWEDYRNPFKYLKIFSL